MKIDLSINIHVNSRGYLQWKKLAKGLLFSMNILNQSKSHPVGRGGGGRLTPIWEIGDARRKIRVKRLKETILSVTQTKGAFQKSELAGRIIAGPGNFDNEIPRVFVETPFPSCTLIGIWLIWLDSFDESEILIRAIYTRKNTTRLK